VTPIRVGQLAQLAPNCTDVTMAPALDAAAAEFGIDTPLRIAHWLGQLFVESMGFRRLQESLNYSAERLVEVWRSRFPNLIAAQPYAHNPEKLANRTYGGRLGNSELGDGWKYRGGGLMMITGRDNYARVGLLIGEDLVEHPELLRTPVVAARAAGAFWQDRQLNDLADRDDVVGITHAINGGEIGLAERKAAVAKAKAIWR
jgi:putative chitinase